MEFNKRLPIYRQLAEIFRQKMASGEFLPGSELPSRRQVASDLCINPNTVQRAYSLLESEGLIETKQTNHSQVTEDVKRLDDLRQDLVALAIDDFLQKIRPLHVEEKTLMRLLERSLDKKEESSHD
ncbi:GntR family transcriptional regulator [Aerococcus christensenii]|uniref:Transcriptional regulator, GntR family n=1 Tax=Aerococcus christensenii TaxID=87541 RepID=A0A0X8F9A6_9LACT|nr:GntR family transcriptional regulator [Aerococcus christensenii]AMB92938.1 hypothetical protein AWM71_06450 [Aerococcus christensenii]KXB38104.1 transcriptional regulator, GntR family [Aerococcus christensenii]MDK8233987.1 GntR family transcriptional regulator [Aerococcus christensenii]WEB71550.1 GntR family transcriptional regulator [Aerococcus christensenii]